MSSLLRDGILAALRRDDVRDRLVVSPLLDLEQQVGPGTIDLRLGTEFIETTRHQQQSIDPVDALSGIVELTSSYIPLGGEFTIHPAQFVLGHTMEFVSLPPDLIGQVLTRSSWGRLGLLVATAVLVQPGYKGILTLELFNAGTVPIVLRPGLRIAQLQLWQSTVPTSAPYSSGGKYTSNLGPEPNRLTVESEEREKLKTIGRLFHHRRS